MTATNGRGLWSGLPCKPDQEPENKRPKIEQRTAILSMSRVVRVKIIQWENIIKGLSTTYPYLTPFKSKLNNFERNTLDFSQRCKLLYYIYCRGSEHTADILLGKEELLQAKLRAEAEKGDCEGDITF